MSTITINEMKKEDKVASVSMIALNGDEAEANIPPTLEHETSRLIRTLASRVKQFVTLIILVVMLVACVAGLVTSLFKHSQSGGTMEDSQVTQHTQHPAALSRCTRSNY